MRRFLCETSLDGYRALSVGRHLVYDSWDQVHAFLRSTLGEAHAALFAEPHAGNGVVSWMTTTETDPVPVASLPEADRAAVLERLRTLMDGIAASADERAARPKTDDESQRWAALLRAILTVPTSRDLADILYVADGQPVLVQWGTRDENATLATATLQDKIVAALAAKPLPPQGVPLPPAPPAGPVAPESGVVAGPARGGGWLRAALLWLLFASLVAAIYWQLLLACVVTLPFGATAGTCTARAAAPAEGRALADERAGLDATLAALRGGIAQAPQCRVETALLPPAVPPPSLPPEEEAAEEAAVVPQADPPQEETDLDRAREQAGGQVGDVTITLLWNGHADLDLMIDCPDGNALVGWRPPVCGGEIDIDANRCDQVQGSTCVRYRGEAVQNPVENAFFLRDGAPRGGFQVQVRNFASSPDAPTATVPFALQVRRGDDVEVLRGALRPGETAPMTTFTIE